MTERRKTTMSLGMMLLISVTCLMPSLHHHNAVRAEERLRRLPADDDDYYAATDDDSGGSDIIFTGQFLPHSQHHYYSYSSLPHSSSPASSSSSSSFPSSSSSSSSSVPSSSPTSPSSSSSSSSTFLHQKTKDSFHRGNDVESFAIHHHHHHNKTRANDDEEEVEELVEEEEEIEEKEDEEEEDMRVTLDCVFSSVPVIGGKWLTALARNRFNDASILQVTHSFLLGGKLVSRALNFGGTSTASKLLATLQRCLEFKTRIQTTKPDHTTTTTTRNEGETKVPMEKDDLRRQEDHNDSLRNQWTRTANSKDTRQPFRPLKIGTEAETEVVEGGDSNSLKWSAETKEKEENQEVEEDDLEIIPDWLKNSEAWTIQESESRNFRNDEPILQRTLRTVSRSGGYGGGGGGGHGGGYGGGYGGGGVYKKDPLAGFNFLGFLVVGALITFLIHMLV